MPNSKGPNKSELIRSMPDAHPSEIVKAAAAKGIKLTPSFVYAIRAMDKKRKAGGAATRGPRAKSVSGKKAAAAAPSAAARSKAAASAGDLRHQFVQIAMRIGTDEAQRLLDRIIEVQTPLAAFKR